MGSGLASTLKDSPEVPQTLMALVMAYDFKVGDLRGMYAVFIPDLQEVLQQGGES